MGGICSSSTVVHPTERTIENDQIDRLLEESAAREELHFKILCLGAGESGKSTIVKQLTFIHKQAVSPEERLSYIKVLQNNTIQCMITLIRECECFGYHHDFNEEERMSSEVICAHDQRVLMPYELASDIDRLWCSTPIQLTYERRNEFWHLEATEYYFHNVHRYCSEGFIPTEDDIVMARKRTTGVVVTELDYGGIHWSCVDVGGQRSERRKWLNCFDNVKAIIYVVNLAGYCKVLFEDKAVNRMHESLNLFEATMSNPLFAQTPVFVFLNKKDLFEQLIRERSIDCCFPEYSGPSDLHSSIEYITEEYSRRLPAHAPKPTFLLLAARMKKDVQYCFEEVKDVLLEHHKKGITKAKKALLNVEKRNKEASMASESGNPSDEDQSSTDTKVKIRGLQGFEYQTKRVAPKSLNATNASSTGSARPSPKAVGASTSNASSSVTSGISSSVQSLPPAGALTAAASEAPASSNSAVSTDLPASSINLASSSSPTEIAASPRTQHFSELSQPSKHRYEPSTAQFLPQAHGDIISNMAAEGRERGDSSSLDPVSQNMDSFAIMSSTTENSLALHLHASTVAKMAMASDSSSTSSSSSSTASSVVPSPTNHHQQASLTPSSFAVSTANGNFSSLAVNDANMTQISEDADDVNVSTSASFSSNATSLDASSAALFAQGKHAELEEAKEMEAPTEPVIIDTSSR